MICGLLFLAATINYIDRQVIGILKPTLQGELGWSEIDYGDIVFAFQLAYAIGFIFSGRLIDRLGTKRGFALALSCGRSPRSRTLARRLWRRRGSVLAVIGLRYSASVAGFIAARFAARPRRVGQFPRHRSRPSPSGFRGASARWRRASSTRARTSARS